MSTWTVLGRLILAASLVSTLLGGCIGIGYWDSNDPRKLQHTAFESMRDGRSIPAELALKKALRISEEQHDEFMAAETHSILGNLYKNGHVRPSLIDPEKSRQHFQTAHDIYQRLGYRYQEAKALFGLGEASAVRAELNKTGDMKEACEYWKASDRVYTEARKSTRPDDHGFQVFGAKDFPTLVSGFLAKYCGPSESTQGAKSG